MITEEQKAQIDALSFDELSDVLHAPALSSFQGKAFDYVVVRFSRLNREKDSKKHQELVELQGKRARIAEEANKLSKIAISISIVAILIGFWGFLNDFKLTEKTSNILSRESTANSGSTDNE
jgi:hypothetical protein